MATAAAWLGTARAAAVCHTKERLALRRLVAALRAAAPATTMPDAPAARSSRARNAAGLAAALAPAVCLAEAMLDTPRACLGGATRHSAVHASARRRLGHDVRARGCARSAPPALCSFSPVNSGRPEWFARPGAAVRIVNPSIAWVHFPEALPALREIAGVAQVEHCARRCGGISSKKSPKR